jgi:hypothetical protein
MNHKQDYKEVKWEKISHTQKILYVCINLLRHKFSCKEQRNFRI